MSISARVLKKISGTPKSFLFPVGLDCLKTQHLQPSPAGRPQRLRVGSLPPLPPTPTSFLMTIFQMCRFEEFFLTEYFADAGVVHVWTGLEYLPPFFSRPHHESIHGSLDVRLRTPLVTDLTWTQNLPTEHLT